MKTTAKAKKHRSIKRIPPVGYSALFKKVPGKVKIVRHIFSQFAKGVDVDSIAAGLNGLPASKPLDVQETKHENSY